MDAERVGERLLRGTLGRSEVAEHSEVARVQTERA
jgi:hypothetical protein